jgi:energy-converting hydrogenase Eha subunit G
MGRRASMIEDLTHAITIAAVNTVCVIGIIIVLAVALDHAALKRLTDTPSYSTRLVIHD